MDLIVAVPGFTYLLSFAVLDFVHHFEDETQ